MRLMKTADQPLQRPPAALTRSSCRAEWIGTAQDGTSQQAPRTDVDASAELSDREKFVRALSRDSAERAPRKRGLAASGKAAWSRIDSSALPWLASSR